MNLNLIFREIHQYSSNPVMEGSANYDQRSRHAYFQLNISGVADLYSSNAQDIVANDTPVELRLEYRTNLYSEYESVEILAESLRLQAGRLMAYLERIATQCDLMLTQPGKFQLRFPEVNWFGDGFSVNDNSEDVNFFLSKAKDAKQDYSKRLVIYGSGNPNAVFGLNMKIDINNIFDSGQLEMIQRLQEKIIK